MNSWRLLLDLVPFNARPSDRAAAPVFQRELARPPAWKAGLPVSLSVRTATVLGVVGGLGVAAALAALFYALAVVGNESAVMILPVALLLLIFWHSVSDVVLGATGTNVDLLFAGAALLVMVLLVTALLRSPAPVILMMVTVPLVLLVTRTALALGPAVARERQARTWALLRATPLTVEALLVGKVRGALWPTRQFARNMRRLLLLAGVLMVVALFLVTLGSLFEYNPDATLGAAPGTEYFVFNPNNYPNSVLFAMLVVAPLAGVVLFVLDRAQHFALMVVAALAASVSARSVTGGLAGALTAALLAWGVDICAALLALALLPQGGDALAAALVLPLLGPLGSGLFYLAGLAPGDGPALALGLVVVYLALTLLIREGAVRALWWWVQHTARQP